MDRRQDAGEVFPHLRGDSVSHDCPRSKLNAARELIVLAAAQAVERAGWDCADHVHDAIAELLDEAINEGVTLGGWATVKTAV